MTNADRKTDPGAREQEQERQGPVVRDKRRIDPETGAVREPAAAPAPASAPQEARVPGDQAEALKTQLDERTTDLQRLQAEYANYRKRVERDRIAVREQALANVLTDLLPVLDDLDRARQHGELTGGFQKIAESLEGVVTKLGLTRFGEQGEPFDPTIHEALLHSYSDEVTEPSCVEVLQPGYAVAGRVLRPARVAVAEPAGQAEDAAPEPDGPDEPPAAASPGPDAGDEPAGTDDDITRG